MSGFYVLCSKLCNRYSLEIIRHTENKYSPLTTAIMLHALDNTKQWLSIPSSRLNITRAVRFCVEMKWGMQPTEINARGQMDVKIPDVFRTVRRSQGHSQSDTPCLFQSCVFFFGLQRKRPATRIILIPISKFVKSCDNLV